MEGDRPTLTPQAEATVAKMRARIFALLSEFELTDDEDRHDLATFVLQRRVSTFRDLTEDEWRRLYYGMTCAFAVREMRQQKGLVDAAVRRVDTWWDDDMVDPMFLQGVKAACRLLREKLLPASD
jgi:hypothetical protein